MTEVESSRASAADARDDHSDRQDHTAEQRDNAADRRDQAGDQRDVVANRRDQAAGLRDEAANERDHAAEQSEAKVGAGVTVDAGARSLLARRDAASDRERAAQDRVAGASERTSAEIDRATALADRGASAADRRDAGRDELTGLYLRGPGLLELDRMIARASRTQQSLVLAFIDVDHLKKINDACGHAAGDRMLLDVANTLGANLRPYDLIIRFGGDEFVCVVSGVHMAEIAKRLERVRAALAEAPETGSVSIGLAEWLPEDSREDLIARADAALYRERQQRRPAGG